MSEAARAAEMAARNSYGRLLAYLSARTHDIAQAEDALADAFAKALSRWPQEGVPRNPDAWLLTVARNRLTDGQRRQLRFPTIPQDDDLPSPDHEARPFPDERLALLMVCAHPAIARDLHTPLMLQTVLGIDAGTIAHLFLISPAALAKRLVRAKAKIRDAGVPFELPDAGQLHARSTAIFEAIYALHALDWLDPSDGMGEEALFLADLLCRLMPRNAMALGLSALVAFSHARAGARVVDGVLVPTAEQDTALWDQSLIDYGKRRLAEAFRLKQPERFQIEAAIEAVHVERGRSGVTDWQALEQLYHARVKLAPSSGAAIAQAVVTARLHGAEVGLTVLERLETEIGTAFQPLWAVRADLYARLDNISDAAFSYEKALSLTTEPPVIRFLRRKLAALNSGG